MALKVSQPLFHFCQLHGYYISTLAFSPLIKADRGNGGVRSWLLLCSVMLSCIYRG